MYQTSSVRQAGPLDMRVGKGPTVLEETVLERLWRFLPRRTFAFQTSDKCRNTSSWSDTHLTCFDVFQQMLRNAGCLTLIIIIMIVIILQIIIMIIIIIIIIIIQNIKKCCGGAGPWRAAWRCPAGLSNRSRNPRPQLEPQISSLDKCNINYTETHIY